MTSWQREKARVGGGEQAKTPEKVVKDGEEGGDEGRGDGEDQGVGGGRRRGREGASGRDRGRDKGRDSEAAVKGTTPDTGRTQRKLREGPRRHRRGSFTGVRAAYDDGGNGGRGASLGVPASRCACDDGGVPLRAGARARRRAAAVPPPKMAAAPVVAAGP